MKYLLLAFLFVSLTACNSGENKESQSFTLNGNVEGIADQKVYLKLAAGEQMEVQEFESAKIIDGKFQFTGRITNPPAVVSLSFEDPEVKLWKNFVIDNSKMTLSVWQKEADQYGGIRNDAKLSGSASHEQYDKYLSELQEINKEVSLFAHTYRKLGNNGQLPMDQWSDEDLAQVANMEKLDKEATINRNNYLLNLAEGDDDLMKLFAIPELYHWSIAPFNSLELCEEVFAKLDASIKTSHIRTYYASEIFRKSEQSRLASEVSIGSPYKDFTQNDQHGNPITASNTIKANKYVLLDFWASWCGPCREENPNLLKAYKKYNDKGFSVMAISIDDKKKNWLKAIEKDGMPWAQVSDLKGANNIVAKLYSVTAVPSSFLIDSNEGTIIATDLRGEALHQKLEELLGK